MERSCFDSDMTHTLFHLISQLFLLIGKVGSNDTLTVDALLYPHNLVDSLIIMYYTTLWPLYIRQGKDSD